MSVRSGYFKSSGAFTLPHKNSGANTLSSKPSGASTPPSPPPPTENIKGVKARVSKINSSRFGVHSYRETKVAQADKSPTPSRPHSFYIQKTIDLFNREGSSSRANSAPCTPSTPRKLSVAGSKINRFFSTMYSKPTTGQQSGLQSKSQEAMIQTEPTVPKSPKPPRIRPSLVSTNCQSPSTLRPASIPVVKSKVAKVDSTINKGKLDELEKREMLELFKKFLVELEAEYDMEVKMTEGTFTMLLAVETSRLNLLKDMELEK
eukprot:Ihof_evm3s910 gene=Ihof_evmTU3s910